MAWPSSLLATGANASKAAEAYAALCVAINQREKYSDFSANIGPGVFNGTQTVWPYAGTANPTASNFAGLTFNSSTHRTLISSMYSAINGLRYSGAISPTLGVWRPSVADIWSGETLDLTKNHLDWNNLFIMRRALDRVTKIFFRAPSVYVDNRTWSTELPLSSISGYEDVATLWAMRTDEAYTGFDFTRVGAFFKWNGAFIGSTCASYINTGTTQTYQSAKYLGKLVQCPIAVTAIPDTNDGLISFDTTGVYSYQVNGTTVSVSSVGFLSIDIPIATDIVSTVTMTTEPDFSGTVENPEAPVNYEQWELAATLGDGLPDTPYRWVFDMSTLLTDQT